VFAVETASELDPRLRRPWLLEAGLAVTVIATVKLLLHLFTDRNYGYFVDELYYLSCARHLAWGYVDQPPLIAFVTWLVSALLGDSLSTIRLLPAVSGAVRILLTGLITRELGGRRFAQGLAALCVLLAPGFLALDHFLTMNTFEPLFWMGCAWLVIRMIRSGNTRLWLWFGLLAGAGLENKYSMAMFGFGVVAGLLLTEQRRLLQTKWLWIGGAVAFLLFLPNVLWNIQHGFPFLELQENIRRSGRNVALPPPRPLVCSATHPTLAALEELELAPQHGRCFGGRPQLSIPARVPNFLTLAALF
jgi:4-amino-4-deoxy-L-arabinose transferase-like glycosyltransferase